MDNTMRLKADMQQMIAEGKTEYTSFYGSLLFEGEYKHLAQTFCGMEKLIIKPHKDGLLFDVKIDKGIINALTEEDLLKVKQCSWSIQMHDSIEQLQNSKKSDLQKEIESKHIWDMIQEAIEKIEAIERTYRKPTEEEERIVELSQQVLNKIVHLKFVKKLSEDFLSLEIELPKIELDNQQLLFLHEVSKSFDCFFISPVYRSDMVATGFDKALGVRIFLGLKLSEEI